MLAVSGRRTGCGLRGGWCRYVVSGEHRQFRRRRRRAVTRIKLTETVHW